MRKGILFSLLCLIAIVSVACGGGNTANTGNKAPANGSNAGGGCTGGDTGGDTGGETTDTKADPQAQWDALYKAGASWVVKMDFGSVMLQKTEVVEVKDGVAKVKTSMKMGDAEWMAPTDGEAKRPEKVDPNAKADPKLKMLGEGDEKIKDWDTHWTESEYDGVKSKVWMSTKYGCVVKMTDKDGKVTMELQELNAK